MAVLADQMPTAFGWLLLRAGVAAATVAHQGDVNHWLFGHAGEASEVCTEDTSIQLNFSQGFMLHSNLGGMGPDPSTKVPKTLRFARTVCSPPPWSPVIHGCE